MFRIDSRSVAECELDGFALCLFSSTSIKLRWMICTKGPPKKKWAFAPTQVVAASHEVLQSVSRIDQLSLATFLISAYLIVGSFLSLRCEIFARNGPLPRNADNGWP